MRAPYRGTSVLLTHLLVLFLMISTKEVNVFVVVCLSVRPEPDIVQVQALADISRSALCCHSNESRAPITNPPNSAQLEGTAYHSPELHPDSCSSVGTRQEQTDTQTRVTNIHFVSSATHTKSKQVVELI